MQTSPFLNDSDFITWLANKAWIISIDDDSQIETFAKKPSLRQPKR